MAIRYETNGDTLIIHLDNKFDFDSVEEFRDTYKGTTPKAVTVNFANTSYMDSSGLGMLLNMHRTLGDATTITLANCQPAVKRILAISRFENFFSVT
ncbi:STAS domain-containing protein [Simiduia sp. 21SJ11W-1]|uniref:STAS domain-containing protein n=1 Tax=Simiduia sp. 21SJ11W-1 TaxID=2909669 RepID=UPI00209D1B64|nr:STAS domain-containing protein [Simiduia sp. 21SJ11W-1]UTA47666.1 STAS domain-containing protein [Simiduia sp. 21SJ11W-1]